MKIDTQAIIDTGADWVLQAPATASEIQRLESELDFSIPTELRAFLETTNGLRIPDHHIDDPVEAAENGFEIVYGIDSIILETQHFRMHWLEEGGEDAPQLDVDKFLIVADDGGGNPIVYAADDDGSFSMGLLYHETREYEPWEDLTLMDSLPGLHG